MKRFKKFFFALAAVVALSVVGASTASAACTAAATTPVVRLEGTTELVGTIIVTCDAATPAASPGSFIQVTLSGVAISPGAGSTTDTNAPGPATISTCSPTAPSNTETFPCPSIAPSVIFVAPAAGVGVATSVSGSTVTFANILPTAGAQQVVIRSIRANIAAAGLARGIPITATVGFGGAFASAAVILTVATTTNAIDRLAGTNGFQNGGGIIGTSSTIISCAPARRTPTGSPETATAIDILGATLAVGATDRLTRLTITSAAAGQWRTAAAEDSQPTPAGTGVAALIGAPTGTRFVVTLTNIPSNLIVYAPRALSSVAPTVSLGALGTITGGSRIVRVTGPEADGSGGGVGADIPNQFDRVPIVGSTGTLVYEVVEGLPAAITNLTIVFTGIPPVGVASSIEGNFGMAPVGPPSRAVARPQFTAAPAGVRVSRVLPCASYLLFPWAAFTGDGAYDTGFAIANTSIDPISGAGTDTAVPHAGDVTLHFWRSGGGTNPAPVKIATALAAGQTATYVLSAQKDAFTGYVIAACTFAFGHGFAFINSPSPGSGGSFAQGYLAISLPFSRTVVPESMGQ